jgi:hypothetical protein
MKPLTILFPLSLLIAAATASAEWKAADIPIMTKWGKEVTPENAWIEYPRPQLVREDWQSLNGLWEFVVTKKGSQTPTNYEGEILVPYPIESALSGVQRDVDVEEEIWYRRSLTIPEVWEGQRILLHFEAVDWETTVWINGKEVGSHRGGYNPFSFDISDALSADQEQTLLVRVWDPQGTVFKSLGKQDNRAEQYTRCSGIWGSVWMEPLPSTSIESIKITASADGTVVIIPNIEGSTDGITIRYEALDEERIVYNVRTSVDRPRTLEIRNPKTWSPQSPFLYDLNVKLIKAGEVVDEIRSYFGLRTIALQDSDLGKQMALNGEAIFQIGPLDQNYWPGGGLTPPSDEAMIWECQYLKDIGCNMVRLHIKQNPRRWYYHCDRLGLLVWQDFISAQKQKRFEQVTGAESAQWLDEQEEMMDTLHNHPSIIKWIIFNEAWGQHDTERILKWTQEKDASRIISAASGWYDLPGESNIRDIHDYSFYPAIPALGTNPNRAVILGEVGGFAGAVPPHNWTGRSNVSGEPENILFGGFDPSVPRDANRKHDIFRPTFTYGEPFQIQYSQFVDSLCLLKNNGLTAVIYTQMTDMKLEENGWLTFDREVSKIEVEKLKSIHERLYKTPPKQSALHDAIWKYSDGTRKTQQWKAPDFDDSSWQSGVAPFGKGGTTPTNTTWLGGNLNLRQTITLNTVPVNLSVRISSYLDGPNRNEWIYTKVYVNGEFVQDDQTRQFMPELRVVDIPLWPEAMAQFNQGENTIAVEVIPGFGGRSGRSQINANGKDLEGLLFDFHLMRVGED